MADEEQSVRQFESGGEASEVTPGSSGAEGAAGVRTDKAVGAGMGGFNTYDAGGPVSTSVDDTGESSDPAAGNKGSTSGRGVSQS